MILSNKIKSQTHQYDDLPFDRNFVIEEKRTEENGQEVIHLLRRQIPRQLYDQTVSADMFKVDMMIAAGIPLGNEVGSYINESAAQQYRSTVSQISGFKDQIASEARELANENVSPQNN